MRGYCFAVKFILLIAIFMALLQSVEGIEASNQIASSAIDLTYMTEQFPPYNFKENGELAHGGLPFSGRHCPFFADIAQGQVEQLGGRIVVGEVAAVLDDFAQTHVDAFQGVGRIDGAANFQRIGHERRHLLPVPAPQRGNRGILLAPV